jgi:hypothetical protein
MILDAVIVNAIAELVPMHFRHSINDNGPFRETQLLEGPDSVKPLIVEYFD